MPRWSRRLAYRLKERLLGRDTLALLPELERNQYLPPEELAARQWAAQQAVARFAFAHVPFYRRAWAGLDLDEILRDPAGWARLPLLTRAEIRAAGDDLVAPDLPGLLMTAHTWGTTYDRLTLRADSRRAGWSGAARLRAWRWWGLDYGAVDSHLRLREWMPSVPLRARVLERVTRLGARLVGARHVDGCATGPDDLERIIAAWLRDQPEVIVGYGSLLGHLGLYLQRQGRTVALPRLRAVIYNSDALDPAGARALQQALGAPTACDYACREFGLIAFQCPAGGLHIPEDTLLLETVDEAGQPVVGRPGRIVLSDLRPSRTPLIRYPVGDMAELAPRDEPCPCGVTLRRIKQLTGRVVEMVPRPDGTLIHPWGLDTACQDLPFAGMWQLRVTLPDRLRLLIEMPPEELARWHDGILARLRAYAGPGFYCSVEPVERIPPHPNGKSTRVVIE